MIYSSFFVQINENGRSQMLTIRTESMDELLKYVEEQSEEWLSEIRRNPDTVMQHKTDREAVENMKQIAASMGFMVG